LLLSCFYVQINVYYPDLSGRLKYIKGYKMSKPLIWAHRGASGYAPENTLTAFEKANEMHADGIELDLQMTKDGVIVVCHDEELERVSNGKGWLRDYTFDELRKLNFNQQFPDQGEMKIPTMEEVFELVKPTNMTIDIELKTGIVFYPIEEKIDEMTRRYGMEDRVIYSSFNHASMVKMKQINSSNKVGMLYADGPVDAVAYCRRYGFDALHPALYNIQYPHFMEDAKAAGIMVNVWTINTEEYVKMCVDAGVDAVITNYPDMARRVIDM